MKYFLVVVLFLALIVSCNLAPGAYVNAESYTINLPEEKLATIIEDFKSNNPEYNPPPKRFGFRDGRRDDKDHWYHVYFQIPKENKIMKTWIRKSTKAKTRLAFIAVVKDYYNNGEWKFINKDYSSSENKKVIKEFEDLILYQLGINDFIEEKSFFDFIK